LEIKNVVVVFLLTPITINDIRNTISSMKNNKAPGPDGIPIEFYKAQFVIKNYKKHTLPLESALN